MAHTVLFLGRPGAGKGTQAAILSRGGYHHLSMGHVVRTEIAGGTDLGRDVRERVERGELVTDDQLESLFTRFLAAFPSGRKLALDGVVRTGGQCGRVGAALSHVGRRVDRAILLEISGEEARRRLRRRREQEGRADDADLVIEDRLRLYEREIPPVIKFYEEAQLLRRVDGEGEIEAVARRVREALSE